MTTPSYPVLQIEREFAVPVAQLFAAFKTPESIKAWWWPKGLHSDYAEIDFRKGGHYFINMKGYEAGGGGMTGDFLDIVENHSIQMTDHFSDERGRAISAQEAKMPGIWPEVILIRFEFETNGNAKSRFKLTQEGIPAELQKDCVQGWSESFDKLEAWLVAQKT